MAESFTADDHRYMQQALRLAARGQGRVEPNPMVGCVLVRGGTVVGQGYHRRFGGPHAEVYALRQAAAQAGGATAYVTLEPCCYYGKTPACTDALIAAGIKRVIAAMVDPSSRVRGRGFKLLRQAGITTAVGLCEEESRQLNAPFLKLMRTGQPWVILKWAQSLDGKIATRTGDSKWISSPASRKEVHALRSRVDAVIIGSRTALIDDPLLTCRDGRPRRVATRIVLDPELCLSPKSRLVTTADQYAVLVFTLKSMLDTPLAKKLRRKGVTLIAVPRGRGGLNLGQVLDQLGSQKMTNVLVEGGGQILGALWDANLVDEAIVYVARRFIGGRDAPSALNGLGPATMSELRQPTTCQHRRRGGDDVYRLRFGC